MVGAKSRLRCLHQQTDSTSVVLRGIIQDSQERAGRRLDNIVDVTSNEQQNNQEDSSSDGTNADTSNHDLRALHRWVGDFLDHVGDTVLAVC